MDEKADISFSFSLSPQALQPTPHTPTHPIQPDVQTKPKPATKKPLKTFGLAEVMKKKTAEEKKEKEKKKPGDEGYDSAEDDLDDDKPFVCNTQSCARLLLIERLPER